MKTFERFMGESIVLYCIPGKAWALGLSYHGTSSQFSTLRSWRLPDAVRTIKSKLRWQDYPSRSSPCPLRLLYMRDVQTQKKGVNLNEIDS